MSLIRPTVQAAAAAYMYWGFQALHGAEFFSDIDNQYGGHYQFLTILGLHATLFYLALSLLTPLLPSVFRPISRVLLLLALPVETVVTSIYWSLILLAPQLILPPATPVDGKVNVPGGQPEEPNLFRIPLVMDLALHATPAIVLMFDFFVYEKAYRGWRGTWGAAGVAAAAAVGYGTWAEWCGARNDMLFPYPFLTFNPFPVRVAIYGGATTAALGFFFLLNKIKKSVERSAKGKGVANGSATRGRKTGR